MRQEHGTVLLLKKAGADNKMFVVFVYYSVQ